MQHSKFYFNFVAIQSSLLAFITMNMKVDIRLTFSCILSLLKICLGVFCLFVCFAYLFEVSPTYTLISLFTISSGLQAVQAWGGGSYLHSLLLFFHFREQNMVFLLRLYWSMHKPYNQTQNYFLFRLYPALLVLLICRVSRCLHWTLLQDVYVLLSWVFYLQFLPIHYLFLLPTIKYLFSEA